MSAEPLTIFHMIAQLRLGAGRVVADAAIEQARGRGHRVTVCVSADAEAHWRTDPRLAAELERHNIEVHTLGDFFHRRPDQLRRAAEQLRGALSRDGGAVVVHAHTAMAAAVGHWAQPDALVATCHGWGAGRPQDMDLQDALAYQLCDAVLTYSRHWAARLSQDLGVRSPRLIPMGLDLERFPESRMTRRAQSTPFRVVTVCELTARKGVDLLLDAMPAVWSRLPDAELHIMGTGDLAAELRFRAADLDPGAKRIVFYGAVANPYARLAEFDLFALASRSDNLPVVLLEAMLAGLPIVAAGVGGVPDLLCAAGCGAVVPSGSPQALADEILAMARLDQSKRVEQGYSGEQYARREFDARRATACLEQIYLEALDKKRTEASRG